MTTHPQGPEYTPGKRTADGAMIYVAEDGIGNTLGQWTGLDVDYGNARLSVASDNAVLSLADHLGCNAVELAERLADGGLVEVVEALDIAQAHLRALDGREMLFGAGRAITINATVPLEKARAALRRLSPEKE